MLLFVTSFSDYKKHAALSLRKESLLERNHELSNMIKDFLRVNSFHVAHNFTANKMHDLFDMIFSLRNEYLNNAKEIQSINNYIRDINLNNKIIMLELFTVVDDSRLVYYYDINSESVHCHHIKTVDNKRESVLIDTMTYKTFQDVYHLVKVNNKEHRDYTK